LPCMRLGLREEKGFFLTNFFTPVTLGMREGMGGC